MRSNTRRPLFPCQNEQCQYTSTEFNKTLKHVWDKHGLTAGFSYQCGVADCTRKFTNTQSYQRHARNKHTWFYNTHFKRYDKNTSISDPFLLTAPNDQEDEDGTVDISLNDTVNNGSALTHNCDVDMWEGGSGEEALHYEDFNQDIIVGSFLLGLIENVNKIQGCHASSNLLTSPQI